MATMQTLKLLRTPSDHSHPRLRSWQAHGTFIQGIVVSPDGKHLYTSSEDGGLSCWDFATGDKVRDFKGHRGAVNHLALTPGGERMVSASDDRTLRIWDVKTGKSLRILKGHTGYVSKVGIAQQGERLIAVSSSKDTTLRVWDLDTFKCIHELTGHTEWASSLTVSADGARAVSGSPAREMKVWDLVGGTEVASLMESGSTGVHWMGKGRNAMFIRSGEAEGPGHTGDPEAMAFLAGERLVSVEQEILVWDLKGKTCQPVSPKSHHAYQALARFSDSQRVAVVAYSLEIWDLNTGTRLAMQPVSGGIKSVALTPDEEHLITASKEGEVVVWDVAALLEIGEPEGHFGYVKSLRLVGDRALTSGADGRIIHWDLQTGRATRTDTLEAPYVTIWKPLSDGKRYLTVDEAIMATNHLRLWHIDQEAPLLTVEIPSEPGVVTVSPDEKTAFCFDDKGAYSVELTSGAVTRWTGKAQHASAAIWTADGQWVLTTNHYRSPAAVPLWNAKRGARGKTFSIDKSSHGHAQFIAFSTDEQTIIAGWSTGHIHTWARKSRKLLHSWHTGHHHNSGMFINSTGELITQSSREPMKRWDLSGTLLGEIPMPWHSANQPTFSPDHSLMVAVCEEAGWVIGLADGAVCATFTVPEGVNVRNTVVSNDGKTVVLGLKRGSVLVYRLG
ncbi:MAG: WD40 repeat protein [Myxococcota bacterium]|jgi:WD40 repeat protein